MSIRPHIVPLALLTFVIGISSAAAGGERQPFKITVELDPDGRTQHLREVVIDTH